MSQGKKTENLRELIALNVAHAYHLGVVLEPVSYPKIANSILKLIFERVKGIENPYPEYKGFIPSSLHHDHIIFNEAIQAVLEVINDRERTN